MAKRFTATEKWKDPWFCSLTDNNKLFWFYLLDNCDLAGIWDVNWWLVGTYIKNFKYEPELFADRIVEIDHKRKWFVPKFIQFQYGEYNSKCTTHIAVIRILKRYSIDTLWIEYRKGINTLMDMDKDKEKIKDKSIGELHKDKDNKFILPDWIDPKTWTAYLEIRKAKKAASTAHALTLIVSALDKFKAQGYNPQSVLEQSIIGGWTGVFPLRANYAQKSTFGSGCPPIPGKYDNIKKYVSGGE